MVNLGRKAMLMPSSWQRALICIIPYFHLIGKYAWLGFKYNALKAYSKGMTFTYGDDHFRKKRGR